jgi:hypothetical protein
MASREASFESALTRRAMALAVVPGIVVGLLTWNGFYYMSRFPGSEHRAMWLLFSGLPLLFAVAIVAFCVFVVKANLGRRVTLSAEGFNYCQGGKTFTARWSRVAHNMPKGGKLYRVMFVTDGKSAARIDDLFFEDFDAIVKAVSEAKGGLH